MSCITEKFHKHSIEYFAVDRIRLGLISLVVMVLLFAISYIYREVTSFVFAVTGTLILWIIKYMLARWLGASLRGAFMIVGACVLMLIMDLATNKLPSVLLLGSMTGFPDSLVYAFEKLNAPWIETLTIPVFLLLILSLGWRLGWLSIVLLWLYTFVIPEPVDMILTNAFSDAPYEANAWIRSAIACICLSNIAGLMFLSVLGMAGFLIGKWRNRSVGMGANTVQTGS